MPPTDVRTRSATPLNRHSEVQPGKETPRRRAVPRVPIRELQQLQPARVQVEPTSTPIRVRSKTACERCSVVCCSNRATARTRPALSPSHERRCFSCEPAEAQHAVHSAATIVVHQSSEARALSVCGGHLYGHPSAYPACSSRLRTSVPAWCGVVRDTRRPSEAPLRCPGVGSVQRRDFLW